MDTNKQAFPKTGDPDSGMSLLTYLASQAMIGILAQGDESKLESNTAVADRAVEQAKLLIEAINKED